MLNVKYLLVRENGVLKAQINENELGNAWTVDSIIIAETADMALEKMKTLNFKNSAIVIKKELPKEAKINFKRDSLFNIEMNKMSPQTLKYKYKSKYEQLVVFSEMYYPKGWSVTLNNESINHFPVNYILRGIIIPKGEHEIKFSFFPDKIILGTSIRWISLLLFLIISLLSIFKNKRFISVKKMIHDS